MAKFAIEPAADGRLVATGELSFETAAQALRQGDAHLVRGGNWVVDLAGVESGDSAGLAVLIEWLATARSSGASIRYERVPEQMLAIARISDIDELLTADC